MVAKIPENPTKVGFKFIPSETKLVSGHYGRSENTSAGLVSKSSAFRDIKSRVPFKINTER